MMRLKQDKQSRSLVVSHFAIDENRERDDSRRPFPKRKTLPMIYFYLTN